MTRAYKQRMQMKKLTVRLRVETLPFLKPYIMRLYISLLAWERLGISQEELESVAGEKEAWRAMLSLLPPRPGPG